MKMNRSCQWKFKNPGVCIYKDKLFHHNGSLPTMMCFMNSIVRRFNMMSFQLQFNLSSSFLVVRMMTMSYIAQRGFFSTFYSFQIFME
ncbi:hypothetical protein GIB67_030385 [Kingdonia uniflora]|uniref:Uncharacterized protein n=1 Tax=Kingdonia uniflora TaxID=39325 RepID=A0A7J7NWT7_9MAGN|nr:hypothetical protein GIB67_030385 [Kingdonia uniflora]